MALALARSAALRAARSSVARSSACLRFVAQFAAASEAWRWKWGGVGAASEHSRGCLVGVSRRVARRLEGDEKYSNRNWLRGPDSDCRGGGCALTGGRRLTRVYRPRAARVRRREYRPCGRRVLGKKTAAAPSTPREGKKN